MNFGMGTLFAIMFVAGYLLAPTMLIWGWVRWMNLRTDLGRPFFLSLIGFILSTASALLALGSIAYAVTTAGFAYWDPRLLRIFRLGVLLSMGGIVLGLTGILRPNALRLHAPLAGLGTLAFWIVAAAGE